jgi:hypothetical protein
VEVGVWLGSPASYQPVLSLDSSGHLGIGTTSPSVALDVNGSVNATDVLRNGTPIVSSPWSAVTGGISFGGGKVGINTESPSHSLHVADSAGIRQNQLFLSGSAGWSSLSYNAHHSSANNAWVFPDPGRPAVTLELDDGGGRGRLSLWSTTTSNKTAWVQRLHVDGETGDTFLAPSGGRVGVGFGQPRTQLHVLGRISSGADFTSAGAITFFPPDGFAWFHIDNGPAGGRPLGRMRFSFGGTRATTK